LREALNEFLADGQRGNKQQGMHYLMCALGCSLLPSCFGYCYLLSDGVVRRCAASIRRSRCRRANR
jgi:hypothetical protein